MPDFSNAYEILAGMDAVKLYYAPTGTAEPEPGGALPVAWVSLGETDGGVTVSPSREITEHFVDQLPGAVKASVTKSGLVIKTALAVATLENWAPFFGTEVETTTAGAAQIGKKRLPLNGGLTITEYAFYLTGKSAYGDYESGWWIPRAYIGGEAEIQYTKENKAVLPLEIHVLAYADAASADEQYGVLTHKTADATA